jgi:hypothetical protein
VYSVRLVLASMVAVTLPNLSYSVRLVCNIFVQNNYFTPIACIDIIQISIDRHLLNRDRLGFIDRY